MQLSEFDFELPEQLIALRPAEPRGASRLLVCEGGRIEHRQFSDIASYLRPGDRLVLNETKVLPARLTGVRKRDTAQGPTEVKVELTLLSLDAEGNWLALGKPAKRIHVGEFIEFANGFHAELLDKSPDGLCLRFNKQGGEFDKALAKYGVMPLPPYIASKRGSDEKDIEDYQPVFARVMGAVASPTASLHFTDPLLQDLAGQGIDFSKVILHVGAGTFLPVKSEAIGDHVMHAEWGQITQSTVDEIQETKARGGRIVAVGTTALRLLEAASSKGTLTAFEGETDIFIKPGFKFNTVDGLITNFHLPKSTLLMLVSALIGVKKMHEIYAAAIKENYRFFSYGDSSLLFPKV